MVASICTNIYRYSYTYIYDGSIVSNILACTRTRHLRFQSIEEIFFPYIFSDIHSVFDNSWSRRRHHSRSASIYIYTYTYISSLYFSLFYSCSLILSQLIVDSSLSLSLSFHSILHWWPWAMEKPRLVGVPSRRPGMRKQPVDCLIPVAAGLTREILLRCALTNSSFPRLSLILLSSICSLLLLPHTI